MLQKVLSAACLTSVLLAACGSDSEEAKGSAQDSGQLPGDAAAVDGETDAASDAGSVSDASSMDASDAAASYKSAGCDGGGGLPEGENTFTLDGLSRRYMLRLPKGYPGTRAWPVVFALHGNGGSVSYWDGTSGSRNIRKVLENDAILIVAEAIDGQWRDYKQPASTWPARIESELLYFEEILKQIRADLCIDNRSIFSMGFSGGGSFSGVLGCRRTDIRAIAVGGSVIYFDEKNCIGKPAAWITIGKQEVSTGRTDYRDFFRDRAGCSATSASTPPAPCVAYDSCNADTPVHYCEHPDGHIWPDFGSQAMWDFFGQFVGK
jgi:poly(3-hydroxybutyrate) depolymerase